MNLFNCSSLLYVTDARYCGLEDIKHFKNFLDNHGTIMQKKSSFSLKYLSLQSGNFKCFTFSINNIKTILIFFLNQWLSSFQDEGLASIYFSRSKVGPDVKLFSQVLGGCWPAGPHFRGQGFILCCSMAWFKSSYSDRGLQKFRRGVQTSRCEPLGRDCWWGLVSCFLPSDWVRSTHHVLCTRMQVFS